MKNIHVTKDPVTLEGYQAILKPSKFGYSLKAVVGSEVVEALERGLRAGTDLADDESVHGQEEAVEESIVDVMSSAVGIVDTDD